jgi:hypothetical protein
MGSLLKTTYTRTVSSGYISISPCSLFAAQGSIDSSRYCTKNCVNSIFCTVPAFKIYREELTLYTVASPLGNTIPTMHTTHCSLLLFSPSRNTIQLTERLRSSIFCHKITGTDLCNPLVHTLYPLSTGYYPETNTLFSPFANKINQNAIL